MATVGIFAEGESRQFSLTPLAEPLQSDVPGSKRAMALMSGDEQFRSWAEIEYSIQTGRIAFEKVFGKPIFDYLRDNPDKAGFELSRIVPTSTEISVIEARKR